MKHLFLILGFLALYITGFSQVDFGIKAGLNYSNVTLDLNDYDEFSGLDPKGKFNFHLGLVADIPLSTTMGLQTGAIFSRKGWKFDLSEIEVDLDEGESIEGYYKAAYDYIDIPLHFTYKADRFQLYAGPYVSIGLGGELKYKVTYTEDGYSETEKESMNLRPKVGKINDDDDDFYYNGLDYGLNFGVGFLIEPVLINVGYSVGLANWTAKYENEDYNDDSSIKNRVLTLSATYFFASSKKGEK